MKLTLVLLLCLTFFPVAILAEEPADTGVPSIDELQKQLDQKKAAQSPRKAKPAPAPRASAPSPAPTPAAPPETPSPPAADDKIRVSRTVPYANEGGGTFDVDPKCNWTSVLIYDLVKSARGRVETTDRDLDRVPGKTLKLEVLAIHTSGGGVFSGRKWVTLRGELRANGQVVYHFEMTKSSADPFRFSSCSVANKLAGALAGSIADWLKSPRNMVDQGNAGGKGGAAGEAPPAPAPGDNPQSGQY